MKLDYFTLLSDEPIGLSNVGNLIPPKLIQIRKRIGFSNYNMFLVLLRMTPEMYYTKIKNDVEYWESLTKKEKNSLKLYDVIKKEKSLEINYIALLSFFFEQDVVFKNDMFLMLNPEFEHQISNDSINTQKGELVGIIYEENFKTILSLISQLCYMDDNSEDEENLKFKNSKAKRLWEKMKKANLQKKAVEDSTRSIPNMISSISAQLKIDINQVWNWTVFQLYDQFTRIGFCEAQERNARSVSVWGDKEGKYKSSVWCTNYYEK